MGRHRRREALGSWSSAAGAPSAAAAPSSIWGCEAVAVEHAGRANPNQLRIGEDTIDDLAGLRRTLVDEHRQRYGTDDDLLVGLQLTHSGRFCRPTDKARSEPWIPARHPVLDQRFGIAA